MVLASDIDLLHPPADLEKRKHKLKRLVQSPNSYFMDVKCQGCFNITTVFSHSQNEKGRLSLLNRSAARAGQHGISNRALHGTLRRDVQRAERAILSRSF
ncbi:hypothetical protein WJX74_000486 [Apatococcus lobatus]|uniref:40S ribosomal protein S27 n=2 Tax=Apatococcus TaxID=904362 RepID=A0AAW1TGS0_9CHLO